MSKPKYAAYKAADPYFNLVRRALGDLVDGEHFSDIVTDDTIYEVLYDLGWPRVIRGRADLMNALRGYVDIINLQSADNLVVHTTDAGHIVVIEYEVHGTVLATGANTIIDSARSFILRTGKSWLFCSCAGTDGVCAMLAWS
jgi:hypothetical protein